MLDRYIKKFQLLTADECDMIVLENRNAPWSRHGWYNNESGGLSHRTDDPSVLQMDKKHSYIVWRKMEQVLGDYFGALGHEPSVGNLTIPRFNKYEVDQKMDWHVDHIRDIFDGNNKGIPILSFITLLNDDYEGGEFCFDLAGTEVEYAIGKGECLVWPSVFLYPHYVKPVTQGIRQSFVIWGF